MRMVASDNTMPNKFHGIFYAGFFFLFTFVGDHYVGVIPTFWLIFTFYILGVMVLRGAFRRGALVAAAFVLLLLCANIYWEFAAGNWPGYAGAYLQIALSIGIYYITASQMFKDNKFKESTAVVSLFVFAIFVISISREFYFGEVSRSRFVFGPNIMYRLYAIIGIAIYFLLFRFKGFLGVILKLFVVILTIAGCLSTGSRGGLIMIAFFLSAIAFAEFFDRRRITIFWLSFMAGSSVLITVLAYFAARAAGLRSAYFSTGNNSEAQRLGFFESFIEHIWDADALDWLVGTGSANGPFAFYPHNVFLETLTWGGFLPGALAIGAAVWLMATFIAGSTGGRFYAAMGLVVLIGAQFSGSLLDNYSFISMAIAGGAASCARGRAVS